MNRASPVVIAGWRAVLLAPIALPLALIAGIWPGKRTRDRSADEVVGFLRDFLEGGGGPWDWDEFETTPITDPELERIRQQATTPSADLRKVLADAERIAQARSA